MADQIKISALSSDTPVDTAVVPMVKSGITVKSTWTTIKAFLKTYFDTLYPSVSSGVCDMSVSFGGNSVGVTYGIRQATWQLVGKVCTISGYITLTSKGTSTGTAGIGGLPFTVKNSLTYYTPLVLWIYGITFANQVMGYATPNTKSMALEECMENGAITPLTNADFTNTSGFMFSVSYVIE